ncbi:FxsA family membrane protein [Streptomyces sp. NPDC002851]
MTTGIPTPPTRPARRSALRRYLPLGVAAGAVLEIWLLTVVARVAGGFTVFLLVAAGIVLGAAVIKRAGRRAFRTLNEQVQQVQRGEVPAEPAKGGGNALTMLAGLLLMMPGLISDVLGLLCLLPPVRSVLGRYAERALERRMRAATPGSVEDMVQQARMHRPDGKVVPGEVIRDDDAEPRREDDGPRPPLTG